MKHRTLQLTIALLGGLALTLVLVLLAGWITPVRADPASVLYVAPGGSCNGIAPCYGSVQAAVDAAAPSDEIRVAAGIYTDVHVRPRHDITTTGVVTQVVCISKTVTVRGGYTTTNWTVSDPEAQPTTLDAQGQGRVLYITGDISPTIEGLRITGGNAAALSGTPRDEDGGGGVYIFTATADISNNRVFSNTADYGGGLYLHSSTTILTGNIVSSNIASHGGGLYLLWSNATLSGNTVSSNTGGGLTLGESDATLNGNTVSSNAGFGLALAGSNATLSSNTISSNTDVGLALAGSDATLSGNIVSSNPGGGLTLYRSDATLTNNIVADNRADTAGTGLYIVCSSPRLLHNTIARNGSGDGSEVYATNAGLDCSSVVIMTNTILVNHSVGISVTGVSTVTINGILWNSSTPITISQSTTATVVVQNQYTGDPAFAPDGYHIKAASAAMDTGVNAGVTTDIDGHHRPYGSAPDLGADEVFAPSVPPDAESTLVYTDTQGNPAIIQVPVGAVTETTNLIYIPIDMVTSPSGFTFANRAFDLDAYQDGSLLSGFTFGTPVTITLHYAETDVVGGGEDTLVLKYWDDSGWVDAASTCTPTSIYDRHLDENWLAVPICHLSRFALFGEVYTVYLPLALRSQ